MRAEFPFVNREAPVCRLLMLHGSGSSKEVFSRQFDSRLADRFRMIAIDLPGHGGSSDAADPGKTYTIGGLAGVVSAVADRLGLGRFAILGWSLGGHIAIEMMSARSDIAGLVLCATPPLGRGPLASFRGFHTNWDLLLASREKFSQRDAERLRRLCFRDAGDPSFLSVDPARRRASALEGHPLHDARRRCRTRSTLWNMQRCRSP